MTHAALPHGAQLVRTPEGDYRRITVHNGTIADASAASITITSEDGFEQTYRITGDTAIRIDRHEAAADDLAAGRPARVVADVDRAALRIGSTARVGRAGSGGRHPEDAALPPNRTGPREQMPRQRHDETGSGAPRSQGT